MWSAAQRRVVLILVLCLIVAVLLLRRLHRVTIPDPQPPVGTRAAELQDRVDPNTADADTLAALPTLGAKRAAEIVHYRQTHRDEPFRSGRDLLKLKGIGVATTQNIEPFLMFSTTAPARASE